MNLARLRRHLAFLKEIDKTKSIFRRTRLFDGSRHENDAEHSWHLALMALTLAEHANAETLDLSRVVKMVLIHDIVEIDVGDTIVYDTSLREAKKAEEARAAARIFGLLPDEQRAEFVTAWEEFEARETAEAKFAAAIDRLEPILQNAADCGRAWREHGVTQDQARAANCHIAEGSAGLWQYVEELFAACAARGYFAPALGAAEDLATANNGCQTASGSGIC